MDQAHSGTQGTTSQLGNDGIAAELLAQKLRQIEEERSFRMGVVDALGAFVRSAPPWDLYRINPMRFAAAHHIEPGEAIDLFLVATLVGLCRMEWRLLCPNCADTLRSFRQLNQVHPRAHCTMCQIDVCANLDDFIHVTFTIAREVRALPCHDPDALSIEDWIYRFRFDGGACLEVGGQVVEALRSLTRAASWLSPGQQLEVSTEAADGLWSLQDLVSENGNNIEVTGDPAARTQHVQVQLTEDGWRGAPHVLAPGSVVFQVTNLLPHRASLLLLSVPHDVESMPIVFPPVLTANRMLASQTFRNLFGDEVVASKEGIGIRDLTLLFTDLKGSTAMYDRIGDLRAFSLVQQHFVHLSRAITTHQGATVKTIGDAVMAAFTHPADAVRAALAMRTEIEEWNQQQGSREIVLKIGIHRGSCIAVTLNGRLDYFGQSVNIAARVQGLADGDELCVTDDVYEFAGVREQLAGFEVAAERAQLKGIARPVPLRRVRGGIAAP